MDHEQATRRFYQLVWPWRADVLRVARFLSRDWAAAEDLAQETLFKAFRAIDRLDAGPDVKAWLLAILRNTWRDRVRALAAHPESSLDEISDEPQVSPEPDAAVPDPSGDSFAVLDAFSDQQVIDALQSLPRELCWTLVLLDVQGMSIQETAELLEVPAGTIKSRAHRGRRMLRDALLPLARDRGLISRQLNAAVRPGAWPRES